ncbi:MAG: hypothetical protein HQK52_20395 [Oligoflexia bacterium]|nr:hypothetical protein [Oligoflexia bacterium]
MEMNTHMRITENKFMLFILIFYVAYMILKLSLIAPYIERHYDAFYTNAIVLIFVISFYLKPLSSIRRTPSAFLDARMFVKSFPLQHLILLFLVILNSCLLISDYDNFDFNKQVVFLGKDQAMFGARIFIDIIIYFIVIGTYVEYYKNITIKVSLDSVMHKYKISHVLWHDSLWLSILIGMSQYCLAMVLNRYNLIFWLYFFYILAIGIFILLLYENYRKVHLSRSSNTIVIQKNIFKPTTCVVFCFIISCPLAIVDHFFPFSKNVSIILFFNILIPLGIAPFIWGLDWDLYKKNKKCAANLESMLRS